MGSLSALKTLDLSHNRLGSLPPSIYSLPNLNYLNVSHNRLHALIEEGLEHLHVLELNMSANSLSRLPVNLSKCKRLKVLRVEENCLTLAGLPSELFQESTVSLLCLEGNLIKDSDLQHVPGYHQVRTCHWDDLYAPS
jgi:Leucine-rich repeat (LRR) protein